MNKLKLSILSHLFGVRYEVVQQIFYSDKKKKIVERIEDGLEDNTDFGRVEIMQGLFLDSGEKIVISNGYIWEKFGMRWIPAHDDSIIPVISKYLSPRTSFLSTIKDHPIEAALALTEAIVLIAAFSTL